MLARAGPGPWSTSRYEVYAALLSVTVIPVTLRLAQLSGAGCAQREPPSHPRPCAFARRLVEYRAALSPEIGVLFIIIKKMSADLLVFAEIFTVVLVGFALAFVGVFQMHPPADAGRRSLGMASSDELLFGASELDDVFGPKSPIMTPFWRAPLLPPPLRLGHPPTRHPVPPQGRLWRLRGGRPHRRAGDVPLPPLDVCERELFARAAGRETRSSQKAASRPRQVLVSSVVMVNLLVAMFSDTYTKAARRRPCAAPSPVR